MVVTSSQIGKLDPGIPNYFEKTASLTEFCTSQLQKDRAR